MAIFPHSPVTTVLPMEERSACYTNLDRITAKGGYVPFVAQLYAYMGKNFEPYWFVLGVQNA